MEKDLISTTEAAKILGISRIAVFKKIKGGKIQAQKIGRNFVIRRTDLVHLLNDALDDQKKEEINQAVQKAVREYGKTFRLLGKE